MIVPANAEEHGGGQEWHSIFSFSPSLGAGWYFGDTSLWLAIIVPSLSFKGPMDK